MPVRLCFSDFEFNVFHRAGIKNQAADTILRLGTGGTDITNLDDDLPNDGGTNRKRRKEDQ